MTLYGQGKELFNIAFPLKKAAVNQFTRSFTHILCTCRLTWLVMHISSFLSRILCFTKICVIIHENTPLEPLFYPLCSIQKGFTLCSSAGCDSYQTVWPMGIGCRTSLIVLPGTVSSLISSELFLSFANLLLRRHRPFR